MERFQKWINRSRIKKKSSKKVLMEKYPYFYILRNIIEEKGGDDGSIVTQDSDISNE